MVVGIDKGKIGMSKNWYAGWKAQVFQAAMSPLYFAFSLFFNRKIIVIVRPVKDHKKAPERDYYGDTHDYVRCRTMGLAAEEIRDNQIPGNVAEAGVFRGDFARRINIEFPDRKLFLYDTFEGFDSGQKKKEIEKQFTASSCTDSYNNFRDTNVDMVLNKMPFPDQCIIRKGLFPDSASVDDSEAFAFVSLDLDFSEPILSALRFFYPRLSSGGYIFIHDYKNLDFKGVEAAVEIFEQEMGRLPKVPLPDSSGTLVITK